MTASRSTSGRTDLWTVEAPAGTATGPAGVAEWSTKKSEQLIVVRDEREAMGCDCDAPTWTSPIGEWPLKVMLHHQPWCATNTPAADPPPGDSRVIDLEAVDADRKIIDPELKPHGGMERSP